ncbi:MAG TPA: hypothetical protein VI076_16805 [Actinopolymorphaceae bacterium]
MTVSQLATRVLAETPATWTEPEPMTWLEVVGIYVGIPVGLFVLISVLAVAGSWTRGASSRSELALRSAPQWFGAQPTEGEAGTRPSEGDDDTGEEKGGVGARW